MRIFLLFILLTFSTNAYAVKIITVTLSDEEYKAMSVLSVSPEEWIQHAAKNKARKMIDRLVDPLSDKKLDKMTMAEKKAILDTIDIEAERLRRHPL